MSEIDTAINTITQGVYVIGTRSGQKANAMTAAWITQVSSKPASILVAIGRLHYTAELVEKERCFSVNVLSEQNMELARKCGFSSGRDSDKLAGLELSAAVTGAPLIKGVKAHLDCRLVESVEFGDHVLFLAEVVYGKVFPGNALRYQKDNYFY